MSKLVRIVGTDNNEIRNHFKTPISINPDSTVALKNLYVEFNDPRMIENFLIDNTDDTFALAMDNTPAIDVTLEAGEFDRTGFLKNVEDSCNFTPLSHIDAIYYDYTTSVSDKKMKLTSRNALPNILPNMASPIRWKSVIDDPNHPLTKGAGSLVNSPAATVENTLVSLRYAPRNAKKIRVVARQPQNVDRSFQIGLYDITDPNRTIVYGYGARWDAGSSTNIVVSITNGVTADLAPAKVTAQDEFMELTDYGGGDWEINYNGTQYTFTNTRNVSIQKYAWVFKFPVGSGADLTIQSIVTIDETNRASVFEIEVPEGRLRKYLGFPSGTGKSDVSNAPFILGEHDIDGDNEIPGIMVNLKNIPLDSLDGESSKQLNIVDIINDLLPDRQTINYNAQFPVPIALNTTVSDLQEIRMEFLSQADGRALLFSGKAIATLIFS